MISKKQKKINKKQEEPSEVIEDSEQRLTFTVDCVEKNEDLPKLVTAQKALENLFGKEIKLEDFSHREINEEIYFEDEVPGFILALHVAYQYHYSLKLSVSDFIILIGQGLGRHLDKYSEKLRKHFVDHEGKEEIKIRRDEFLIGKQNDWSTCFEEFSAEIKKRIKTDFHGIIVDDTSVATRDSRIVSEIALMDCMKGYFRFVVATKCGIPEITLEGSAEDWENLLNRVKRLEEMNKGNCLLLNFWLKHLIPVVEEICETGISRKPNKEFWSGIYKYAHLGSGNPTISGWCINFFPYLRTDRNFLKTPLKMTTDQIPLQISKIPFIWDYYAKTINMEFCGGFLGAKFDTTKLTVEPAHFWAVAYDKDQKKEEKPKNEDDDVLL